MARTHRHWTRRVIVLLILGLVGTLTVVIGLRAWRAGQQFFARDPFCQATSGPTTFSVEPDQMSNIATIAGIALRRKLPTRAAWIGLATARQESKYRNIDYGDRDSLGLFQQRPSQGWGTPAQVTDPVYATNAFYDALVKVKGYEQLELTVAAQRVQRSGFPEAYAQHEIEAQVFANVLTGKAKAALTCTLDVGSKPVGPSGIPPFLKALGLEQPSTPTTTLPTNTGVRLSSEDAAAWQVAHWAVAGAERFGIGRVYVDGRRWSRANSGDGWTPSTEGGSGVVVMFTEAAPS